MKFIPFLFLALITLICQSCSLFEDKSEEAVTLKIDTATPISGRTVDSHIIITDTDQAKLIK